ncbi:MAG TPA: MFS transporter [Opitutaceae bacterium]|nr:MFS transporter [Opitutaceae bacterium]
MSPLSQLRGLTGPQWRAFIAAYLGWMLDAFDFFLLIMVVIPIAAEFHAKISSVSYAVFLTLATRPIGALLFGQIADRVGRKPALVGSILLFAVMELLTGFAPSLGAFLVLRAIFGIGMGGEWGAGASLAMETVPEKSRGLISGILQQGYPMGYLLAALADALVFPRFGWRGMFILGSLPALLVVFIMMGVEESPGWIRERARTTAAARRAAMWATLRARWSIFLYMAALMAVFNGFSHGSQDFYPSGFLEKQRGYPLATASTLTMIGCTGAIAGGLLFGIISQRFGRRKSIAAAAFLSLPMIPLWIGAGTVAGLAVGVFLMQFAVQGAWGVVPAHLNELSPASVRGTFPGLAYQLGNLGASLMGPFQTRLAEAHGGSYAFALGWVEGIGAVVLIVLALAGPENREANLATEPG